MPPAPFACDWILNQGAPVAMPSSFASAERATTQPSLLDNDGAALQRRVKDPLTTDIEVHVN
ncbi:hypothetical protein AAGW05_10785 [Arthrobacter sp. LAPM80]|uniref:hypothetical protein n=1 Tax=Arthrobacter sp. LAPM80 TaxID=3141788 RepID=UPI00398AA743